MLTHQLPLHHRRVYAVSDMMPPSFSGTFSLNTGPHHNLYSKPWDFFDDSHAK